MERKREKWEFLGGLLLLQDNDVPLPPPPEGQQRARRRREMDPHIEMKIYLRTTFVET